MRDKQRTLYKLVRVSDYAEAGSAYVKLHRADEDPEGNFYCPTCLPRDLAAIPLQPAGTTLTCTSCQTHLQRAEPPSLSTLSL